MTRFYLPQEQCRASVVILEGREAHHGLHVLRLRRGARIVVLDGTGSELECEVNEVARDAIRAIVTQRKSVAPLPYRITLVQAIPKGKLIESIIQKATELGVYRVAPLFTERVVVHWDDTKANAKAEHWRQVAIEAIKQSGSPWLPQIDSPVSLPQFLAQKEKWDLALIGSLQEDSRHPRDWFAAQEAASPAPPQSLCVWVGPEGDFTPAEIEAVKSAGAKPISLGPHVLRSETAAIYCLSVLSYEMQFINHAATRVKKR